MAQGAEKKVYYFAKKEDMLSRHWLHQLTRPAFEEWLQEEPAPVEFIRRWKAIPVWPAYQDRPVRS